MALKDAAARLVTASHSRIIESSAAEATSWLSDKKATALTPCAWPSNISNKASQSCSAFDSPVVHFGIWPLNLLFMMLISGAKIRAEESSCNGAFSSIDWFRKAKRCASRRKSTFLALSSNCVIGKFYEPVEYQTGGFSYIYD